MTEPTNKPKMKPFKAWALVLPDGTASRNPRGFQRIYQSRAEVVAAIDDVEARPGERIARVLITEVPR